MRMWPLALLLAAVGTGSTPLIAQHARSEQAVRDQLSVKLSASFPLPQDAYQDVLESTGDPSLDALLDAMGVDEVRRIFREPPRGWRSPEAARMAGLDRWVLLNWPHDLAELEQNARNIEGHSGVSQVERVVEGFVADTIPNDPLTSNQWAWANDRIQAYKAWDLATDSNVITCVLDTGTHINHPDLRGNLWNNPGEIPNNGIDDDLNGYIDDNKGWDFFYNDKRPNDRFGHGVHTQGTIGASTDNNLQVAGVCWNTQVMAVKIFSDSGGGTGTISAAGMVYAADNGASVFSMSWGFSTPQAPIEAAVDYANALDVVQVAAAHNFGDINPFYPAAYDKVMGIIATDENDQKTSWSNYGAWCSMAAPGNNILSTYLNGGTASLSGTSMSTPHVAGAAALVRQVNPMMDALDVQLCLEQSSKDLGSAGFDINYGWGRLDLFAAVKRAGSLVAAAAEVAPGSSVDLSLHFPGEGGNLHIVLPSTFGRQPGFDLSSFTAGDLRRVPLNEDALLFQFLFTHPSGSGIFNNFIDVLDAAGDNTANFNVPGGNLFAGETFSFAVLTFDPADLSQVVSVSCSNAVDIQ